MYNQESTSALKCQLAFFVSVEKSALVVAFADRYEPFFIFIKLINDYLFILFNDPCLYRKMLKMIVINSILSKWTSTM